MLKIMNKSQEKRKKCLTKLKGYDILSKLSARAPERGMRRADEKRNKKLLKNHLTNSRQCDIIVKSPESDGESQTWSLKIEQQRDEV